MATTADRAGREMQSSKQMGRQLRQVRKQQGLSRADVARSAGLTRRELAAYERGRVDVPESDLWCLAGSCGVDVGELLPDRSPLTPTTGLSVAPGRRQHPAPPRAGRTRQLPPRVPLHDLRAAQPPAREPHPAA